MSHADGLAYGWWKHELPTTLGHPKNFVLTKDEVAEYAAVMDKLLETVEHERTKVAVLNRALSGRPIPSYMDLPQPATLVSILTCRIAILKAELAQMQLLARVVTRVKALNQSGEGNEGDASTAEAAGGTDQV